MDDYQPAVEEEEEEQEENAPDFDEDDDAYEAEETEVQFNSMLASSSPLVRAICTGQPPEVIAALARAEEEARSRQA